MLKLPMGVRKPTPQSRQDDVLWIQMNQEVLWANYPGLWIAVQDQELIAVGESLAEVLSEAQKRGYGEPVVSGVRRREYQSVKMIRPACRL